VSEQAPEAPARPARRENVFTRKIGPLPMWGWLLIVGGGIGAWALYSRKQAGQTTATGTSASQVPQFVNQTYVSPTPPMAPAPGKDKDKDRDKDVDKDVDSGARPRPHPGPMIPAPVPGARRFPGGRISTGGGEETRTEQLRHRGNLVQIAKRNGVSEDALIDLNPSLAKYKGTGKLLPPGTQIKLPAA